MLKVKIFSFSYLYSGIPEDASGHGGGFVFDCRYIKNPGRVFEFMQLTGKDKEVKEYLEGIPDMLELIENSLNIVSKAIDTFISRDFTDLMVSFGCTGGRHRSVYAAEQLASRLYHKYQDKIEIVLKHTALD